MLCDARLWQYGNCCRCIVRRATLTALWSVVCRLTADGISDEEAIRLINIDPVAVTSKPATKQRGGADVFTMGDDAPAARTDPFDELLSGLDVMCPLLLLLLLSISHRCCAPVRKHVLLMTGSLVLCRHSP